MIQSVHSYYCPYLSFYPLRVLNALPVTAYMHGTTIIVLNRVSDASEYSATGGGHWAWLILQSPKWSSVVSKECFHQCVRELIMIYLTKLKNSGNVHNIPSKLACIVNY